MDILRDNLGRLAYHEVAIKSKVKEITDVV